MRARWTRQARVSTGLSAACLALVSAVVACTDDQQADQFEELSQGTELADWEVRPGVEMVTVFGAEAEEPLTLYDDSGAKVATFPADDEGRAHFAYIPDDPELSIDEALSVGLASGSTLRPGRYLLRDDGAEPARVSEPFEVLGRDDAPDLAFYQDQELDGVALDVLGAPAPGAELADGFQYIEMRDGVTLSAMVRFPDEAIYGEAPWPTVVEYSGYGPSNPDAEEPGSRLARSFGYATVSVNMRGTGCSGGVFDTFNPAQQADGYDVIEAVAQQPWVLNSKVGMVGLSYSGISQLYTAVTRPPSLAAVTAQSVIADPWLQQWPQGVYNDGFTRSWLQERDRQSGAGGSDWVSARIDGGDAECRGNVADHELNIDFEAFGRALAMRPPDADARDLRELVRDVDTAVFLTGAFQDEQTGPQFGAMLDSFDNARTLRVGLWNGRHPDGYSTMNLMQWFEFLELYVAERVPKVPDALRAAGVQDIVAEQFGFQDGELGPDRLADEYGEDYEAALAAYEDEDPVRVVFGSGQGSNESGEPGGVFETTFEAWPPPDAEATTWYLGADGALVGDTSDSGDEAVDRFAFDPAAGETTLLDDYSTLSPVQDWTWSHFPAGASASYLSEPLDDDVVVAGQGYVDLWVGANADDADVQVTISEVRADGVEYLVQNGWLRLGHRALDEGRSDGLEVVHSFTEDDYEPLPADELVEARVEIPATGHAFRAGSRINVTVSSPGRNHVTWTFEPPNGVGARTTYRVGHGGGTPSALVLPVVDVRYDPEPSTPAPCPGFRGQACRPYVMSANTPEP
jgi:predicted acyl esterase